MSREHHSYQTGVTSHQCNVMTISALILTQASFSDSHAVLPNLSLDVPVLFSGFSNSLSYSVEGF